MKDKVIIVVGILMALFGAFMIVGNMPVTVEDFEGNLTVDGNLNVTGTGEFGGDVDMNHNYLLNSDFSHWTHFTMEAGVTDVSINVVPSGILIQDRHFHRLTFAVDTAPGSGKECNVTLTDGVGSLSVSLTDAETSGWTETGEFDWDVSENTLTLSYTQDAGGAASQGFITLKYHYKETT